MADSGNSPYEIVKTILGIRNELYGITPIDLDADLTTTLNRKYSVQQDAVPTTKPTIGYFGIGINGCRNVDDGNLSTPNIPSMNNMDMYAPIPFRCVPIDEDLSETERAKYRMRTRQTINDQDYWCYYLKKVTYTDTAIQITRTDPATQEESEYELDPSYLNPTPSTSSDGSVVTSESSEINVLISAELNITGEEVTEYIGIKYGDLRRAKISEIGIYTAEDRIVTGTDGSGNSLTYTEAIFTQLAIHFCSIGTDMSNPSSSDTKRLRVGKGNVMVL